jgi:hypothetical protein
VVLVTPISNNFRSGPDMEIQVAGISGTSTMLRDAAARGEDMRPAMARIKTIFIEGHKEQYASKGGFLGTPWPENSEETLARKARSRIPALSSLMVEEGSLEKAVSGGAGSRSRVSKGSVSVGVKNISVLFAQGGAKGARRGEEPKRVVLGINEVERETSIAILTDFLLGR